MRTFTYAELHKILNELEARELNDSAAEKAAVQTVEYGMHVGYIDAIQDVRDRLCWEQK